MLQHLLEQRSIAAQGHALVGVLEIAAVPAEKYGDPGGGIGVDLLRSGAPLLHGVMDKHMLVDIIGQGGNLRVRVLAQFQDCHLFLCSVGGNEFIAQPFALLGAENHLQGHQVEGNRKQNPSARSVGDIGHHLVGVIQPAGEPGQVLVHPLVVGMKDVGTVAVNQHARPVGAVVGVAADVAPALQHEHPFAAVLRQAAGGDGAGKARADDQCVIVSHRETTSFSLYCF